LGKKWSKVGKEPLAYQKFGNHPNNEQFFCHSQKFGRVSFGHHPNILDVAMSGNKYVT
jgi:hypothetical protein